MNAADYRVIFEQELAKLSRCGRSRHELTAALPRVRALVALAQRSGCGYYSSPEIERVLCDLAEQIPATCAEACEESHYLLVMSEAYAVGGHTRVVERWVELDAVHRYSLVLTRQSWKNPLPARLVEAVQKSGGTVEALDLHGDECTRAGRLRALASRFEKIILHIHTDDVIPLLAFGTERFTRPVGLYNHADHLFWLGASIADRVGEIRRTGVVFSQTRRGVASSMLVGIPPEKKRAVGDDAQPRKREKVLITCGSAEKYRSAMGIDFMKPVEEVLHRVPEARFVGIGMTFGDFPEWRKACRRVGGRVALLGKIPYSRLLRHYDTAAVYLDSRPMAGGTAIADALGRGCPVLCHPGPVGQMDWVFDSRALCSSDDELVTRAVALLEGREDSAALVREEQSVYGDHNRPELFLSRVQAFLAVLQAPHRLHEFHPRAVQDCELDRYHYALHCRTEPIWRGFGSFLNVRYDVTPLSRSKILQILGYGVCLKETRYGI